MDKSFISPVLNHGLLLC